MQGALVLSAGCVPAYAGLDETRQIQLAPQKLSSALIRLGKLSDLSIVFPTHLLSQHSIPALNGAYTPRQILDNLLADTQLQFREISSHVVAIVPRPQTEEVAAGTATTYEEIAVIGRSVTGSRLKRTDLEGASAVDIISAPELVLSGAQTLGEFLRFVPAVSGNSTSTAVSNGGDGTATITLRGLPENNTLVLINGRRVAFDGMAGDAVDLNSIPPSAVERIEILKDGASAVYGSDAIAGVVNVIMKTDYDGLEVQQYYGQSSRQDVETLSTHLLWGKSSDRASLLLSASYYDQKALFSRDRSFSASADSRVRGGADLRSSATPNSRITLSDERVVTLTADSNGEFLPGTSPADFRNATAEDLFNYNDYTSSLSPSDRHSLYLAGRYDLTDQLTLNAELAYTKNEATITYAPTPLFTAFEEMAITLAADNIYNSFGESITDVRRRLLELGAREQLNIARSQRLNLGIEGFSNAFRGGLHWDTQVYWSRSKAREVISGLASGQRVARAVGPSANCQGVEIDGCVPLNLFGPAAIDADQVAYLNSSSTTQGFSRLQGISFNMDTRLAQWPSGNLLFAAGVDIRREKTEVHPFGLDPGDFHIGMTTFASTVGSRDVKEAYFEVQIPLAARRAGVYSLDLEIAGRHSHYSDFGKSTTPKIGLRYRPLPDLLLRATYSEGFRAPSLDELHKGGYQTQAFLEDPCAMEYSVELLPGCHQQSDPTRKQFLTEFSGDTALKPEESRSHSLGLVWTPLHWPGFSFSADHFWVSQRNVVDANPQTIVEQNAWFNSFDDLVVRDDKGNIAKVYAPFINIGERDIAGLDFTMRYQWFRPRAGNFTCTLNGTYLRAFEDRIDQASGTRDLAGTYVDAATEGYGALPEWKISSSLRWAPTDNINLSYSINYISSLTEQIPFSSRYRTIRAWTTHDLQMNYRLPYRQGLALTLGTDNLFDEDPPFVAATFNDNFDAYTYDAKGRYWYARVSQAF